MHIQQDNKLYQNYLLTVVDGLEQLLLFIQQILKQFLITIQIKHAQTTSKNVHDFFSCSLSILFILFSFRLQNKKMDDL